MSFDGRWTITIATPMGKQIADLVIVDDGVNVSGTATQGAETVPFVDARRDGDRLCWTQSITKPMKLSIRFDLVREGDLLSGKAKPGILPSVKVEGHRAA